MAHTIYKNKEKKRVPSVTTILGVMAKPALKFWANKLGLEGVNVRDYVDNLADIGTLAHSMCEEYLTNEPIDKEKYNKEQIETAKICLSKFYEWVKENDPQDSQCEMQLVSEMYQYAGTCDLYCTLNGKKVLVDFKTCKAIYGEQHTQVFAYKQLLEENGYPVDECRILRIGRSEEEGFEEVILNKGDLHKERFLTCLELYKLNKELNKK